MTVGGCVGICPVVGVHCGVGGRYMFGGNSPLMVIPTGLSGRVGAVELEPHAMGPPLYPPHAYLLGWEGGEAVPEPANVPSCRPLVSNKASLLTMGGHI